MGVKRSLEEGARKREDLGKWEETEAEEKLEEGEEGDVRILESNCEIEGLSELLIGIDRTDSCLAKEPHSCQAEDCWFAGRVGTGHQ